jgi:hypothetical protein
MLLFYIFLKSEMCAFNSLIRPIKLIIMILLDSSLQAVYSGFDSFQAKYFFLRSCKKWVFIALFSVEKVPLNCTSAIKSL